MHIGKRSLTDAILQKRIAVLLAVAMLFTALIVPASAEASAFKEEVVYVRLQNNGNVEAVYVINSFELGEEREIVDYGNYSYVRNLTGRDSVTLAEGAVRINSGGDRLQYEGFLVDPELPWDIDITYALDGEPVAADELAGRSGALSVRIETAKNPHGNASFFEALALQIAASVSSENSRNLQAEGGTIASAGEYRQANFVALPGQNTSFELTADVIDFEMPAITIAGVRLDMDFDMDDVDLSDIRELTDGIAELDDGVVELADGVIELRDGTIELRDGTVELFDGTEELKDGTRKLSRGVRKLRNGVREMADGAEKLNGKKKPYIGQQLSGGVDQYFDVILGVANAQLVPQGIGPIDRGDYKGVLEGVLFGPAFAAARNDIETAVYDAARMTILLEVLKNGIPEYGIPSMDKNAYDALDLTDPAQAGMKGAIDAAVDAVFGAQKPQLDAQVDALLAEQTDAIKEAVRQDPAAKPLVDLYDMLTGFDELNQGLKLYTGGVTEMCDGIFELEENVDDLYDGVRELADGTVELHDGVEELVDGTKELVDGVEELVDGTKELADGTGELREETATLDRDILDGIKEEFDKLLGKGKKIFSFVSGDNGEVASVQFVMQTEGITKPKEDKNHLSAEVEQTLWDRFVLLFKRK